MHWPMGSRKLLSNGWNHTYKDIPEREDPQNPDRRRLGSSKSRSAEHLTPSPPWTPPSLPRGPLRALGVLRNSRQRFGQSSRVEAEQVGAERHATRA